MPTDNRRLRLRWLGFSAILSMLFIPEMRGVPDYPGFALGDPAHAQSMPRPASGNVFVLSQGQWREAFIQLATGRIVQGEPAWVYTVQYLDGEREVETGVAADRIRTLEEAFAAEAGQEVNQLSSSPVQDVSSEAGITQMLEAHNRLRREVGISELHWSADLANRAQSWAETLIAEHRLAHSPEPLRNNGEIGENITSRRNSGGAYSTPAQAVAGWVAERHDYDYDTNRCAPGKRCGHYTQMVWADTREVGCGVARSEDGLQEIWVCQYNPGGNFVGQRPY
jgi:pathogenesis-related protein 1